MTLPELVAWGESLGRNAHAPNIITLTGELGAGKTTLAQAICRGYGVKESVTSPTYALVHEYTAPRSPVYHLDLYRLERPEELTNIGWDDIMSAYGIILIEWAERAGSRVPPEHLPIALDYVDGDPDRRLLLAG